MTTLQLLFMAPLVVAFALAGLQRPLTVVLPLYAATVPFGSLLSTGLPAPLDSVSTVLGLLLMAALGLQFLVRASSPTELPATVGFWLLFLGLAGATALWSVSPRTTEVAFRNLALLILLYALLCLTPVDLPTLRRVESALVLGAVAAASYGAFQFATGTLPVDDEGGGGGRFGRDLLGANNTAAALLVPLAIALCRSVTARTGLSRWAHGAATALLLFGILLTGSRGGLLATGACLAVATLTVERGRRRLAALGAAIVVVVALVLLIQPGGVAGRTDSTKSSGRTDIWRVAQHACRTYCLTGSGWGTFPTVYRLTLPRVPDARILERGTSYEPHNIWILIGIEAGVAGLVLAFLGLGFTLRDTIRLPRSLRGPPLAGFVASLVASLFLSNFEYKFFWMTLMYLLVCRNVAMTMSGPRPGDAWRSRRVSEPPVAAAAPVTVDSSEER